MHLVVLLKIIFQSIPQILRCLDLIVENTDMLRIFLEFLTHLGELSKFVEGEFWCFQIWEQKLFVRLGFRLVFLKEGFQLLGTLEFAKRSQPNRLNINSKICNLKCFAQQRLRSCDEN